MNDQKTNTAQTFKGHSTFTSEAIKGTRSVEKPSNYFGIDRSGNVVRRFKLLLRTGQFVSIPYAHLPVVILDHEGQIRILTKDWTILVEGRGLKPLEEYFSNEQVRWIKESPSGIDEEEQEEFINRISIQGELDI